MQNEDKEHRFALYTTPAVMEEVAALVEEKTARLARLKRPSRKQRAQLDRLRIASKEISAAFADMTLAD